MPNRKPFTAVGLMASVAKMPVAIEPQIPLTPWQEKTSRVSSIWVLVALQLDIRFDRTPATEPIISADITLT